MTAIKQLIGMVFCLVCLTRCSAPEEALFDQNFVRFSLRVSKSNELEYNKVNGVETEFYTQNTLNSLKIPIVRSSTDLSTDLKVSFSTTISGGFNQIEISPSNTITIPKGKVSDTIVVGFKALWTEANTTKITFKITEVNDPAVKIGWPRAEQKMDVLTINLGELKPVSFSFEKTIYELSSANVLAIPVVFSQVLPPSLLEKVDLLKIKSEALSACASGTNKDAKYTVAKINPMESSNRIVYEFRFTEDLDSKTKITLLLDSLNSGFRNGNIVQSAIVKRVIQSSKEDPAKNWYDVADGLYRTYGKAWYKDATTNMCRWSTFNTFTKPVPLDKNDPNANVNGYHRFRIAFLGNNLPVGTNPFDFRRFYSGPSVESPAYSIEQAIEFIPLGPNSGKVEVIPQTLLFINTSKFTLLKIPICGSGTYTLNADKKRWEMFLEVVSDESQLGGTKNVSRYMYIYNNNIDNTNPSDLTLPCIDRYDL